MTRTSYSGVASLPGCPHSRQVQYHRASSGRTSRGPSRYTGSASRSPGCSSPSTFASSRPGCCVGGPGGGGGGGGGGGCDGVGRGNGGSGEGCGVRCEDGGDHHDPGDGYSNLSDYELSFGVEAGHKVGVDEVAAVLVISAGELHPAVVVRQDVGESG